MKKLIDEGPDEEFLHHIANLGHLDKPAPAKGEPICCSMPMVFECGDPDDNGNLPVWFECKYCGHTKRGVNDDFSSTIKTTV